MATNLLPIGSVVTLRDAEKKLMIIGIFMREEGTDEVHDYLGVPYPEGFLDNSTMFLFDRGDIASTHFVGYINSEMQVFRYNVSSRSDN